MSEGILMAGLSALSLSRLQKLWWVELILVHFSTHLGSFSLGTVVYHSPKMGIHHLN